MAAHHGPYTYRSLSEHIFRTDGGEGATLHLYRGTIYLVSDRQRNNGEADTRIARSRSSVDVGPVGQIKVPAMKGPALRRDRARIKREFLRLTPEIEKRQPIDQTKVDSTSIVHRCALDRAMDILSRFLLLRAATVIFIADAPG